MLCTLRSGGSVTQIRAGGACSALDLTDTAFHPRRLFGVVLDTVALLPAVALLRAIPLFYAVALLPPVALLHAIPGATVLITALATAVPVGAPVPVAISIG